MRWQQLPKAVGDRDLPLVLFKLPIRPRLSLGTFVGNVKEGNLGDDLTTGDFLCTLVLVRSRCVLLEWGRAPPPRWRMIMNTPAAGEPAPKPREPGRLEKAPTGIQGLDEITCGGLPRGRTTLVC